VFDVHIYVCAYAYFNLFILCNSTIQSNNSLQTKKGVKRKADTTTPCTATTNVVPPPTSMPAVYKPPQPTQFDHSIYSPASLACRRESRTVKKPKKDLDEDLALQSGNKTKKEPLSEQMKYCGNILKELFSKKHAVSNLLYIMLKPTYV